MDGSLLALERPPIAADPFEALRETEFGRLDQLGQVYLDYTGAALYPDSLVWHHARYLTGEVLGNPHSVNPASARSSEQIDAARHRVLRFLDADPSDYAVIFTFNTSAAIKLVAESFPFTRGSRLLLTADNHNSVNGIREYAGRAGAEVTYLPMDADLGCSRLASALDPRAPSGPSLLAYPAQSNFSGVKHPLEHVATARQAGYRVLLDAAAFVPSNPLSLTAVQPDFVGLSFYKMFGFPTGIGALVARHEALEALGRPWFAGGTVDFASTQHPLHQLATGEDAFEDGTPSFAAARAVIEGLDFLDRLGMKRVQSRVDRLGRRLGEALSGLRHRDGSAKIRLYGGENQAFGGCRAFNVLDAKGLIVPYPLIEAAAGRAGLSIRGGCFCNPGCAESAFSFPPERSRQCLETLGREGFSEARFARCLGHSAVGAIRASLGIANRPTDIDRLVEFLDNPL